MRKLYLYSILILAKNGSFRNVLLKMRNPISKPVRWSRRRLAFIGCRPPHDKPPFPEGTLETEFTMERKDLIAEYFEATRLEAHVCPKYDRAKAEAAFQRYPDKLNIKRIRKVRDRKYPYPLKNPNFF